MSSVKPPDVVSWQNAKADYVRQWGQLLSSIKGSAIDPLVVDCTLSIEDMVKTAISLLEGMYYAYMGLKINVINYC